MGVLPAQTIGPVLVSAAHAVLGETPSFSLALWHGFTLPLLMSAIALVGGMLLYLALRGYFRKGIEGPPLLRKLKGKRIFERVMVALSWRLAKGLEGLLGTRRLQPQLFLVVVAALLAAWVPLRAGVAPGSKQPLALDPSFVMLAGVGMACAVGAAWKAKFHRVTALMLIGGAGLVFLHLLRVVVGAGPGGNPAAGGDGHHDPDPARAEVVAQTDRGAEAAPLSPRAAPPDA